ncbi:BON domain-containing protein [Dictyobacter arantiisoli]|uniref:BON domain-containing protein n=1 Tax=Dictyobacter arantiisoli TaxID=2014874 RepID=A0A5A5TDS0_9CHLR|nr:BON domain-containing protein [Dictyobacter arantiisoli]GCF09203.1 hypothetical protein KDI_27670 [Dictyobacter arantiisoli]
MDTSLISETEKFHFGGKVFCSDGEAGILSYIMTAIGTRRVISLGVKLGRFVGKTVEVPFSSVLDATGNGVTLSISRAELAASQTTVEGTQLDHRTVVHETVSGSHGTLRLFATQPQSGELAFIVAHALRGNQDLLLREEYILKIEKDSISATVPEAVFQTLPAHRLDSDLQSEVESVLFELAPLHVDFPGMRARVLDSILYLDGNISSSLRADIVEDQVSGIAGILEIKNRLIGDDILAADLALALGRDPRTREQPIGVYPRLGVVRLSGSVHTPQQKAAAEKIAESFTGVRSIVNDLVIKPKSDILNVMAASSGGDGEDIVPGKFVRHTK